MCSERSVSELTLRSRSRAFSHSAMYESRSRSVSSMVSTLPIHSLSTSSLTARSGSPRFCSYCWLTNSSSLICFWLGEDRQSLVMFKVRGSGTYSSIIFASFSYSGASSGTTARCSRLVSRERITVACLSICSFACKSSFWS